MKGQEMILGPWWKSQIKMLSNKTEFAGSHSCNTSCDVNAPKCFMYQSSVNAIICCTGCSVDMVICVMGSRHNNLYDGSGHGKVSRARQ